MKMETIASLLFRNYSNHIRHNSTIVYDRHKQSGPWEAGDERGNRFGRGIGAPKLYYQLGFFIFSSKKYTYVCIENCFFFVCVCFKKTDIFKIACDLFLGFQKELLTIILYYRYCW